jgi:hypothetical protein
VTETPQGSVALEPEPPRERVRVREQLRHKLPEILLEAGSVVFAILLAFAVDQWREERGHREMAARARATIISELRANRNELSGTFERNTAVIGHMQEQMAQLRKKKTASVDTTMHLAQLSAAAFQAAQSTQAIQFVDFDWLVGVGRVYELQKTYALVQDAALDEVSISGGAISGGAQPLAIMERINSRISAAQQLAKSLLQAYDEAIAQ